MLNKRNLKRKLKKKEAEDAKQSSSESAGNFQENNSVDQMDLNPIAMCEHDEEGDNQSEEDKDEFAENGAEIEPEEDVGSDRADKPEHPLEENNSQNNEASSHSGFPDFGVESDDDEKNDGYKNRDENLLNLFGDTSFHDHP